MNEELQARTTGAEEGRNDADMSGHQFTFPPPPPAPPQAPQSYPAYFQPPRGHNAYGGGSRRGDRGRRGQGRGSNLRGSRGHSYGSSPAYGGYSMSNDRQPGPHNGGFVSQGNNHRSDEYPLPNYPAIQLPQFPANLGQGFGRQSSNFATNNVRHKIPHAGYPQFSPSSHQQYNGQQAYHSNGYNSPIPIQPMAHGFQDSGSLPYLPHGPASHPAPMDPPSRMRFDEHRHGRQPSSLPQPTASGTMSLQNDVSFVNGSPYRHGSPISSQTARHDAPNSFSGQRGRGQKRGHGEAFGKQRNHNPRPQAAPAVPSFGGALPLPTKPPASQEHARKPRKKKRKHNQLGLTPKTEEHQSSEEEEDDADEESRLAAVVAGSGTGSQLLQFEYNGHTSTLQSSSDIASWIKERRKRYPTKARAAEAAERKRQRDEARKAATQALRESQEKQRTETKEKQRQKVEVGQKRKQPKEDSEDAAARAKRKVEKLRKQLEKEEKRAAKAEAKVVREKNGDRADGGEEQAAPGEDGARKRKRSNSLGSETTGHVETFRARTDQPGIATNADDPRNKLDAVVPKLENVHETPQDGSTFNDPQGKGQEAFNRVLNPLSPISQPPAPNDVLEPQHPPSSISDALDLVNEDPKGIAAKRFDQVPQASIVHKSDSSSETSSTDYEDLTSSSGSSSSESDSDGDAPNQASSRRDGPERVLPPKREHSKNICREFLKSGRCKRAHNCQYRHELPQRGSRKAMGKEERKTLGRTERVGLHQRLVDQEKEKEDHEILKAIIHLGERGLLDQ